MQKIVLTFLLIFVSCATPKQKLDRSFSMELFEKFDEEITVYKNPSIKIFYKTCRNEWRTSTKARDHLREEFFQEYNEKLVGMSDIQVIAQRDRMSGLLTSGGACFEIHGSPVTLNPLSLNSGNSKD